VLTGGSAKMEGAVELAEEVFHTPVRLGIPQYVEGLSDVVRNPIHATGVGLLLYGRQSSQSKAEVARSKVGLASAFDRMRTWFQGNF
jgi:cell division protein FtsA